MPCAGARVMSVFFVPKLLECPEQIVNMRLMEVLIWLSRDISNSTFPLKACHVRFVCAKSLPLH
jgi:hypothetical protein